MLFVGQASQADKVADEAYGQVIIDSFRRIVVGIIENRAFAQMLVIDWGLYFTVGAINVALPLYTAHTLHRSWLYSPILMTAGVGELLAGLMSSTIRKFIHEGKESTW